MNGPGSTSLEDLEPRIVWIFGSPRTGSTWLLRLLVHPWHLARNATGMRLPAGAARPASRPVVPINESLLPRHLTPMDLRVAPGLLEDQPDPAEILVNHRHREEPGYFFNRYHEEAWRAGVRELIMRRFGAQVDLACEEHALADPVVAVKEPNGSYAADAMMALLPRSRLIFLARDGREVLASVLAIRTGEHPESRGRAVANLDDPLRRAMFVRGEARLWVNNMTAVQRAYDRHPPELRRLVRYEELLQRPSETLASLVQWLGLDRTGDDVRAAVEGVPPAGRGPESSETRPEGGTWSDKLTDRDRAIIDEVAGEKLGELGYPA